MTAFKKGDPVEVKVRGVVHDTFNREGDLIVNVAGRDHVYPPYVLTLVEPEYHFGQAYIDSTDTIYQKCHPGWRTFAGEVVSYEYPQRPLRKLVPER